jgi:hypothetical protein
MKAIRLLLRTSAAAESRPGVDLGLSPSRALALPLADPAGFAAGNPAAPP